MIEIRSFDTLPFYWDMPRHNHRKIYASPYVLKLFEEQGYSMGSLCNLLEEWMIDANIHFCCIGKKGEGFTVELTQFDTSTIEHLRKSYNPITEETEVET